MSLEIIKRVEFDAAREDVWKAITDPAELAAWFPDKAADFEAREGYEGAFVWNTTEASDDECGGGSFAVKVEVAEPFHTLVWSWAGEANQPFDQATSTRVEWKLNERDGGGTILVLRETGFENLKDKEMNDGGWDAALHKLVGRMLCTAAVAS